MPVPSTADQFLELTSKSGLLDPQHLQAYLRRRREAGGLPDGPRGLANLLVRDGLLTRFQAEQLLRGRWRNFILSGKYKVLGPLGSGGMGLVYLCEHQVMRRRVAVKVLPATSSDPVALERFHREARAVAQLHHPNIVGGHDVDRDGKLHFLVMEYIDGSTFHRIVQHRGPMDPLRAAHYVRQAALGLQHAHESGLVHRDVKPSNLLLDRTGTVKILDLGLARFFHDESDDLSKRHVESPMGTSDYMAPEQALDSHQADIRADIYSLGATLYFLLAGHGPFRGGNSLQKLICHQFERPRPIRELRPEVPPGLAAVIDRMMAKEPAERYQTPGEVAEALAPWTRTPIPPPPPEEMPELVAPARGPGDSGVAPGLPAALYESAPAPTPPPESGEEAAPSSDPQRPAAPPDAAGGPHATPVPRAGLRLAAVPPQLTPSSPADSGEGSAASRPRPRPPSLPPSGGGNSPRPRPAAPKRRRRRVLLAAVVLLLLLGAGAAAFAIYKRTTVPKGPPAPVAGPTRLKLLVPAYIYPAEGGGLAEWDRIIDSPAAAATVVIANPNSGPGTAADTNYVKVLERARGKGVTVIGYVSTKYAARPLHEVTSDVDRWVHLYPGVQGIFFDEQASGADKIEYYAALYRYARKEPGLSLVITNPGTVCAEDYLARPASDVACLAEVAKEFTAYDPPPWADRYPADHFAALLCKVGTPEQMREVIREMRDKKVGYCFVTDAKEPDPWKGLPSYWEAEAEAVRQVNAGER